MIDSKKLRYSLLMLSGIIALGTCGYYFVEHMPLFEAFYMTIITISTVGFAEVIPLSQAGRAITVIIIILGISVGAYTIGVLVKALVVIAEEKVPVDGNCAKKIDLLYFTYYNDFSNKKCGFEESPFLQNRQWNVA
jgi:hypothetical protein